LQIVVAILLSRIFERIFPHRWHDREGSAEPLQEDRILWQRMLAGDDQALAALFRLHYPMLYDYGLKLSQQTELVKDSIQEIFIYLWEKRATLSPADSVRAYLLVALRRLLLRALAQQQRRQQSDQQYLLTEIATSFSPEDFLIMQENDRAWKQALNKALQEIPPRQREALYLKTHQGMAYREIAGIMNVSPQVARNYVSEAFHRLRAVLLRSRQSPA